MTMRKLLLLFILTFLPLVASAQVEINGIYYYLNNETHTAEVKGKWLDKYSGDVIIPGSVSYEGIQYIVTSIGNNAFEDCEQLSSVVIPNSVITVGYSAFSGCTGLTTVYVGNNLLSVDFGAFEDCTSLTSVHISDLAAWCNISFNWSSSNPLYYARHLYMNGEEIKDLIIPNGVTTIGNYVFENCSEFTSVTIPKTVTSIGSKAFDGCNGLNSVRISDLASWCNITFDSNPLNNAHHLFINDKEINNLIIPNGITSVTNNAFAGCEGLTSLTIPDDVTSIGSTLVSR